MASGLKPLEALEGEMVLARLDIEAAVELVSVDTADTAAELFDAMTVLKQSVDSFQLAVDTLSVPPRSGLAVEGVRTLLMLIGLP